MTWLFKEEPSHYGYEALERDGSTRWTGVKNPLAQKYLARVRKGDRILYYHTGKEKAIVGVAAAVSDAYPDPDAAGNGYVVDVAARRRLERPVTLAEIKANPVFADFALVRMPRLSVMPVPDRELEELSALAGPERLMER